MQKHVVFLLSLLRSSTVSSYTESFFWNSIFLVLNFKSPQTLQEKCLKFILLTLKKGSGRHEGCGFDPQLSPTKAGNNGGPMTPCLALNIKGCTWGARGVRGSANEAAPLGWI